MWRVSWFDVFQQSKWFADKFDAQEFVIELQRQGLSPRVRKVTDAE